MWIAVFATIAGVLVAAAGVLVVVDPFGLLEASSTRAVFEKVDPRKAHMARVETLLAARSDALLAGDEEAWLATVDPGNRKLLADQRRMFRLLRAMRVRRYDQTAGMPSPELTMSATTAISYCFGADTCSAPYAEAFLSLREHDGGLVITGYEPRGMVRPWQVSDLRVEVGQRVVVAAQPKYADRLRRLRRQADRVAKDVERFAPPGGSLGRHVIFLASPGADAAQWYEGNLKRASYGWAYDLERYDEPLLALPEQVLRADKIDDSELRSVLGWHLGYGAAAADTERGNAWALTLGIAVRAQHDRESPARYVIADDLRQVLRSWQGELEEMYPHSADAGYEWQTAAWVVVHRLIKRYGEKEFIAFYNAVARDGEQYAAAAEQHLGRGLGKVQTDLLRYMRSLA